MRVVSLREFVKLPPGTIACEYEPQVFGDTFVKGETLNPDLPDPGDFWRADLFNEVDWNDSDHMGKLMKQAEAEDVPLTFGYPQTREGWVKPDQLYAVWSDADIKGLVEFLLTGRHKP